MFNDMPPLVDDPNAPFIPPPAGVSTGGQPGYSNPFPGASAANWPGTPYPSAGARLAQPTSAQTWTFGQADPWSAPPNPWPSAPTTPGGTWGGMTPAGGSLPHTPYTPFSQPNPHYPPISQPSPHYPPFSQPTTSYQPFSQPMSAGHYPAFSQPNPAYYPPAPQDQGGWIGGGSGLGRKRSNSHHGHPKRPGGLAGLAGVTGYPAAYHGETFDERNLARRPRDWRADYTPRHGITSYLPRVGRPRSDVREYSDPTRRILHPLLNYTHTRPPIYYDLRDDPLTPDRLEFLNLQRAHNDIDWAQLATQPPSSVMRVYHPLLPWYIDVHQSHPNGITVYDVLTQVWQQLLTPISGKHYWNEELGDSDRAGLALAFRERCRGETRDISKGIMQIDFLGRKVVLSGFVRGKNGMWEMKTRKDDPV